MSTLCHKMSRIETCLPCSSLAGKKWTPSTYYGVDIDCMAKPRERLNEYIKIAADEAKKSPMSQKHGCVVIHKNKVVATGYNKQVEPFSLTSIHAEVNALIKAKKILNRSELKQAKLMVVRIGTNSMDNPLKYSKPCKVCQNFIEKLGVQLVYYSTSDA